MQLAMYKGPAPTFFQKLLHWAIRTFTHSPYSHCELVIDGVCWTSSPLDGGVRSKVIDLTSGRWDVYEITGSTRGKQYALETFRALEGAKYDWLGVLRFVLPFIPQSKTRMFCSEAVAFALGATEGAEDLSPADLLEMFTDHDPLLGSA